VLQDRQPSEEWGLFENDFARGGDHVAQAVGPKAVNLVRAVPLAEADDEHFEDAALELAAEVGVRLDARYRDDAVGRQRVLVPPDRLAPRRPRAREGGPVECGQ